MALLDQLFGTQPQNDGGMVQNILQQRFQPTMEDVNHAAVQSVLGPMPNAYQAQAARMKLPMDTATQLGGLEKTGAETQGLNLQNQMQAFQMPYMQNMYKQMYGGNGNYPVGFPNEDPRLTEAHMAAMMGNKPLADIDMARYNADTGVIGAKAQAESTGSASGKQNVENTEVVRGAQDVLSTYKRLNTLAPNAPSGAIESGIAYASNKLNSPTKGAINQGKYDANLGNLYMAMIRSLKGTGRVMQSELDNIKAQQPKSTDSLPVKQAKIAEHMGYYQRRMKELGYDPSTGKPLGNNQLAPQDSDNTPANGSAPSASGLDESDARVQTARSHGYSDDEIRQYMMKGQQ